MLQILALCPRSHLKYLHTYYAPHRQYPHSRPFPANIPPLTLSLSACDRRCSLTPSAVLRTLFRDGRRIHGDSVRKRVLVLQDRPRGLRSPWGRRLRYALHRRRGTLVGHSVGVSLCTGPRWLVHGLFNLFVVLLGQHGKWKPSFVFSRYNTKNTQYTRMLLRVSWFH